MIFAAVELRRSCTSSARLPVTCTGREFFRRAAAGARASSRRAGSGARRRLAPSAPPHSTIAAATTPPRQARRHAIRRRETVIVRVYRRQIARCTRAGPHRRRLTCPRRYARSSPDAPFRRCEPVHCPARRLPRRPRRRRHRDRRPTAPLHYTWRDLERGSASSPTCSIDSRCPPARASLVHADKSVEALMLYLAVLRAGLVYVPLNTAYQASEVEYFIDNAAPRAGRLRAAQLHLGQPARVRARHAHGAHAGRRPHAAACSSAPRTSATRSTPSRAARRRRRRDHLHQRHHGAQQGRAADARQPVRQRATLQRYWDWRRADEHGGDVLIHALPIFHVHGLFVACTARCGPARG